MSLTLGGGPLAGDAPRTVNYRIDGPAHLLLRHDFPRRVRAVLGGIAVADTRHGTFLHETGLLPVLYLPMEDLRIDLLTPTAHRTHCPFKGDASYWTVKVGDRVAENAVWAYPQPREAAEWLAGYAALYWDAMDAWYDEGERVTGLCDPYHRVDVRAADGRVRVLAGDTVLADSTAPLVLSETGLANRFYLPAEDVRTDLLEQSPTTSTCPYKGVATYWSLRDGDALITDVAWSYEQPRDEARRVAGHLSFDHQALTVRS